MVTSQHFEGHTNRSNTADSHKSKNHIIHLYLFGDAEGEFTAYKRLYSFPHRKNGNIENVDDVKRRFRQFRKWLLHEIASNSLYVHYAPFTRPASAHLLCTCEHLNTLCHTPSWPLIGYGLMDQPGLLSRQWWSESIFSLCTSSSSSSGA